MAKADEQEICINCRRPIEEDGPGVMLTKDGHLACCVACRDAHYDAINMTHWCSTAYQR